MPPARVMRAGGVALVAGTALALAGGSAHALTISPDPVRSPIIIGERTELRVRLDAAPPCPDGAEPSAPKRIDYLLGPSPERGISGTLAPIPGERGHYEGSLAPGRAGPLGAGAQRLLLSPSGGGCAGVAPIARGIRVRVLAPVPRITIAQMRRDVFDIVRARIGATPTRTRARCVVLDPLMGRCTVQWFNRDHYITGNLLMIRTRRAYALAFEGTHTDARCLRRTGGDAGPCSRPARGLRG